jgi:hypothetical protein
MTSRLLMDHAAAFALQLAKTNDERLASVSREVRPALRVVDGDLSTEPPPLRRPSQDRSL